MLKKAVYVAMLVSDQDKALDFYTNVIGLEKRGDYPTPDGPRFLTVGVKGQDCELVLWPGTLGECRSQKIQKCVRGRDRTVPDDRKSSPARRRSSSPKSSSIPVAAATAASPAELGVYPSSARWNKRPPRRASTVPRRR